MKLNQLRLKANEKGFTLIELMIVIAIIGILAAIAIPNFITYRDKAFCTSAEKDAQSLQAALANYFSVPTNTTFNAAKDATLKNVINFGNDVVTLSGKGATANTGSVVPGTGRVFKISVKDGSGRCPTSYMDPADTWDSASSTYSLTMQ